MRNPNFTNKDEYLQYRRQWKAEYAALSQRIRESRWATKEFQRAYSKIYSEYGDPYQLKKKIQIGDTYIDCTGWKGFHDLLDRELAGNERYLAILAKHPNEVLWYYTKLRTQAREMLEELKAAKLRAQEQYLAERAQRQAVAA